MYSKLFLLTLAAGATLASCSKDQVVDQAKANKSDLIQFSTNLDHVTRGTLTTLDNINNFKVYAYNKTGKELFNTEVTKEKTGTWKSKDEEPWPGEEVQFYAFSPKETNFVFDETSKKLSYTTPVNIGEQQDVLVSVKSTVKVPQVELNFKHLFSSIEVKAQNMSDKFTVKVKGIKIVNINSHADYTFNTTETTKQSDLTGWSDPSSPLTIYGGAAETEITLNKNTAQNVMFANDNYFMTIPQQFSGYVKDTKNDGLYIALLTQISTKDGSVIYPAGSGTNGKYGYSIIPLKESTDHNKLLAGKKYVYNIKFFSGTNNSTGGAGLVEKGSKVDSKDPNTKIIATDPLPEDHNKNTGDPIIDGSNYIKFTVTVDNWKEVSTDIDL